MNDVWFALGLTAFSGLATGIGERPYRLHGQAVELSVPVRGHGVFGRGHALRVLRGNFLQRQAALVEHYGDPIGHWVNAGAFFGGMLLIGLIDNLIPEETNPHGSVRSRFGHAPWQKFLHLGHRREFGLPWRDPDTDHAGPRP